MRPRKIDTRNFDAILEAAREHGGPWEYETDLTVRDRNVLQRLPVSTPFVWALCGGGTQMRTLIRGDHEGVGHWVLDIRACFVGAKIFCWNGEALLSMHDGLIEDWARTHYLPR